MPGQVAGCQAAIAAWCRDRSKPRPAKFTGRLIAW